MHMSSYNAEAAVLSTILNQIDAGWFGHVSRVAGTKGDDLFVDPRNRAVYSAIGQVFRSDGIPSPSLVADLLMEKEELFDTSPSDYVDYLQLTPIIPSVEQLDTTLTELDDNRTVRKQVREIQEVLTDIDDPEIDVVPQDVVSRLNEIVSGTKVRTETQTFAEITKGILESPAPMWTVSTGIPSIDKVLGGSGLESGCFTLVAARAKVGKTIFMNNLIVNLLEEGAVPVVLNLETKKVEFVAKILSRKILDPTLSWGAIKKYLSHDEETMENMSRAHKEKIKEALEWADEQNWYAEFNKSVTMQDIHALVSKTKAEQPAGARIVLLVDYIQLQVTNARYEREEITQLSRFYKKLAGEMEISVFSLAQLNRDSAEGKPRVSNLRGSGSLEQDADSIIMLYNPEKEDDEDETWKYEVMVEASTTRLAAGDDFRLRKDSQNQLMAELDPERERELNESVSLDDDYVEEII